jgi:hypothetical protein
MFTCKAISELIGKESFDVIQFDFQHFSIGFHHHGRKRHQHRWNIVKRRLSAVKLKGILSVRRFICATFCTIRTQLIHQGTNDESNNPESNFSGYQKGPDAKNPLVQNLRFLNSLQNYLFKQYVRCFVE